MDAYGQPFTHPGLVTNMSVGGLVVQAQFRVVWVDSEGSGEMGLHRVTAHTFISHSVLTHCSQAAAAC